MPDSGSPSTAGTGRSLRRLALVACCLVAVVTGTSLVATVGSGGLAGSPIDSVLPGEDLSDDQSPGDGSIADGLGDGTFGGQGGLGSLTPGTQTGVGGGLGLDNDTFASLDTEVHLTAQSPEPTYWRTAAYGTYTGDGWTREADTEPYDPPLHETGFDRLSYTVTLEQPATALPTPWRPTAVDDIDTDDLEVTSEGGLQTGETLPEGTTFTGVSDAPADSTSVLRAAEDSHPPAVDRYTELPDDVAPRVGVQTSNIVGDADTRYDAVTAVRDWLQADKGYSLDAHRSTDSIAETFIFEMEAGYCEYFATAMATMLRTQDIPTRYAVGYSSGQPVGNDTYEVRAMNAHAWVEVYFEGVGWVQFDPTPATDRLQAQAEALDDIGEDYDIEEPANPGETVDPGLPDEGETEDGWAVETDRTPIPGEEVELTVRFNGDPVPVEVFVDGDPVGVTNGDGTLTVTVPQGDFEVAVRERPPGDGDDDDVNGLSSGAQPPGDTLASGSIDRPVGSETGDSREPLYNETIDVVTDADLEVSGEAVPGNEVGVTALVGGDPLSGAAVFLDGQAVATTDGSGWAAVELPESPGSVTLAVERDPVAGERVLDLASLSVTATTDWPVAVPFAPVTVEATYGDDPAAGLPVTVDGERVTATGTDGEARVRLPLGSAADIAVTQHGVRAETTVDGMLVGLALVAAPLGVLVVGGLFLVVRRGGSLRAGVGRLRRAVPRAGGLVTRLLVAGAGRVEAALGGTGSAVRGTLRLVLVALGLASPASEEETAGRTPRAAERERTADQERVRAAWGRFLAFVSAPAATHTPGELATHAVERDGLPADAVWTLRDAFRAVEYGDRPAEPDRVEAALAAIESAATDGGDRR